MEWSTFLWTTLGAFLTLCTFSFLYKDNPFYKFAEHLVVGVSAGYFALVLWHQILIPNLFARLNDGDWYFLWLNSAQLWYLIPAAEIMDQPLADCTIHGYRRRYGGASGDARQGDRAVAFGHAGNHRLEQLFRKFRL